eukprot:m.58127 g.58127  ORF g.58127 m.58127 type:complete len:252 (+) comp13125_c0_seq1:337-1092(+)
MHLAVNGLHGIFAVYKPRGITSACAVSTIKRILISALKSRQAPDERVTSRSIKVGHGGTLDQLAEGVLVIGVGRGCKALAEYLGGEKHYMVTGQLGTATSTYDADGEPTESSCYAHINADSMKNILPRFEGTTLQYPPRYSALKVEGTRLSDYARSGIHVDLKPRSVHIHRIRLCHFESPNFTLHVKCSAGVYIRSLVHDLGQALGSHAFVTQLIRTQVKHFTLIDALQPNNWTEGQISAAISRQNNTNGS